MKQANDRLQALFSTNITWKKGILFPVLPTDRMWEPYDDDGKPLARIGFLGLTLDCAKSDNTKSAQFRPPLDAARDQIDAWKKPGPMPDAVVALTHQTLASDEQLALAGLEIDLILGGHEHVNVHRRAIPAKSGDRPVPPIYRADANARTVYLHLLHFENGRLARIESTLKSVTDAIPEDPVVAALVRKWVDQAYRAFRADGLDPEEELTTLTDAYDGREESVRSKPTNLTDLIGDAMLAAAKTAPAPRLAIYNSGSVRIDDELLPGPVTTYDVIRVLPFGGEVFAVELTGEVVGKMLDHTVSSADGKDPGLNSGAFLQTRNVLGKKGEWTIGGEKLDAAKTYTVVINDYLFVGKQTLETTGEVVFRDVRRELDEAKKTSRGDWRGIVRDHFRGMKGGRPAGGGAGAAQQVVVKVAPTDPAPPVAVTVKPIEVQPVKVAVEVKGPAGDAKSSEEKKSDEKPPACKWCAEPLTALIALAMVILLSGLATWGLPRLLAPQLAVAAQTPPPGDAPSSPRDHPPTSPGETEKRKAENRGWALLAEVESLLRGRDREARARWEEPTGRDDVWETVNRAWVRVHEYRPPAGPTAPAGSGDERVSAAFDVLRLLYVLLATAGSDVSVEVAQRFVRVSAVLDNALRD